MEFCPKCGSVLVPKKVGRSRWLVCPRCGYKSKIKRPASYKISEKGKEPKEIAVITEERKRPKLVEREYELEAPEYEEEFYE